MKAKYKEIESRLSSDHGMIVFRIVGSIKRMGLNKYSFNHIRDKMYEEALKLYENHVPANETFEKKLLNCSDKLLLHAKERTLIEKISSISFVIFIILAVALPIVYLLNLSKSTEGSIYSIGLDLCMSINMLFQIFLYSCLGVMIALVMQKTEKKKKSIATLIVVIVAAVVGFILYFLSYQFPDFILKVNIILGELIFIAIAIATYFLEDVIAKKEINK